MEKWFEMFTNVVQRRCSPHQNVNYQGHVWAAPAVPRALFFIRAGLVQPSTLQLYTLLNVPLSRLFSLPAALQLLGDGSSLSKQVFCLQL